ncbi:phosphonate ABC transporter ATP-binding protein [bacterium]|jgi:phosphonate transport system ATP-binding protein|nr:phosphonate ABC transporter ATP-binding protein [bacterium]
MIKFINVGKTYPNGFQALRAVNLEIHDGEFVAIIGLSGAGKSTLLRTINKMHPITTGELYVNDSDISKLKGRKLRLVRRNIGMIFQSFNLVKRSSVLNNVLAGRVAYHSTFVSLFNLFPAKDKLLALQCLDKMGILDKAFVRADQLSGGQQQRVALARALAQEPKIILADEPVASLDPITTIAVMNDFKRINEDMGITIIANMHHVDLALQYARRIIGIKAGEIVYDGPSSEVNEEILISIYGRALKEGEILGNVEENNEKK